MGKLLGMATINQYHWNPEAEGDIVDKVKRHVRTLMHQDDRSVIECLSRENKPFCNCMQAKKKEARGMDRKELCSGCGILFPRKGMLKCSGCKIVMFCNEDCQAPDCAYYCKLNEDSGSTENYLIQTETKEGCDTESTAIGCGTCKDKGTSDTILEQAGMPTNGFSFVSYCQGGPCVWTTQKTQCMGLKKYPNIKTSSACKAACCGDYTCAVWQFDADGYKDQCWYGTNCDELGDLTWTSGGIRKMGCDQAPNCVGLCASDDDYYYIRIM